MARPRIFLAAAAVALAMVSMSLLGDTGTNRLANADDPSVQPAITPNFGPPEGGGGCALTGVDGFIKLPTGVGIQFDGGEVINPEVDDKGTIKVVIDFQYASKPGSGQEWFLMGYKNENNAFMISANSTNFRSYFYGGSNAETVGASDAIRHTVTKIGTTISSNTTAYSTSFDPGLSISGTSASTSLFSDWGPLYLGGYSTGDYPAGSFVGTIYRYTIYKNNNLVSDLVPAAWADGPDAQGKQKVTYGFYDEVSKKLFGNMLKKKDANGKDKVLTASGSYSAVFSAKLDNNPLVLSVNATGTTGQGLSFTPNLTCGPIPAHAPGYVPLVVNMNGTVTTVDNAYLYGTPAELKVVKRGWDCGNSTYTYDQIMDGACQEIASDPETILPSGTRVTWTYTVTYQDLSNQSTGLIDVTVTDDKILGQDGNPTQICHFDTLPINTPVGCVASGEVRADP